MTMVISKSVLDEVIASIANGHYQCSVCGRRTGYKQTKTYKYCPKCGAKMGGDV